MKKLLAVLVLFLFPCLLSAQFSYALYTPQYDSTLKKMYTKRHRTYRLLFGKEFNSIKTHNPSLSLKTEKDTVMTRDSLFFPLVQISNASAYDMYAKNRTRIIIIDIDSLQLFYYKKDTLFLSVHIAEGITARSRLKTGTFVISEKIRHRRSKKYENAPMTYSLNLYEERFIHAGEVITGRDSHGCIRVPYVYAREIFSQARIGDTIILLKSPQKFLSKTPN